MPHVVPRPETRRDRRRQRLHARAKDRQRSGRWCALARPRRCNESFCALETGSLRLIASRRLIGGGRRRWWMRCGEAACERPLVIEASMRARGTRSWTRKAVSGAPTAWRARFTPGAARFTCARWGPGRLLPGVEAATVPVRAITAHGETGRFTRSEALESAERHSANRRGRARTFFVAPLMGTRAGRSSLGQFRVARMRGLAGAVEDARGGSR